MKLSIFITGILFWLLSGVAPAFSQNAKVTINVQHAKLSNVLEAVESQTDYLFFYNKKNIDVNREVDLNVTNAPVTEVLSRVLGSDISYTMVNDHIILSKKEGTPATQREITVTGQVIDKTGEPLIGVNVALKGAANGSITDVEGKYSLTVPPANAVMQFSYVGYVTQEMAVGSKTEINVTLLEDTKKLNEVVVIGYGSREKKDITTAISNVDSKTIDKSVSMSAENAMQGTMSGVQVSSNDGNPMNRPTIRIRGTNTWGVADPLYVIDGIPITELGAGIEGQEDARIADVRGPLNIMTMIDPGDIESISVLKDASAAAIYGVRAANGVILITTKKGRKDKPSVDLTMRYGSQTITQTLNWLTTPQYTKFVQGMYASDPTVAVSTDNAGRFDPNDPRYLGNSPTYNWQNAARTMNAPMQDYSVKVSGGTDNTDYYVSLGYSNTQGTLLTNYLERYSGAVKLNTKINDWIKFGINYRLVNANGIDAGASYFDTSRCPPWQPIYSADGIPGYEGYAYAVGGVQPDGTYANNKLYGDGTRINVLGNVHTNDTHYSSLRNMGNAYLELTPMKGLSIKGTFNLDMYNTTRYSFHDYLSNPFDYTAGDPRGLGGPNSVGSYDVRDTYNHNLMEELAVNYTNTFKQNHLDFLFDFSNQHYDANYKGATTNYMTTIKSYLRNLGGENQYTTVGSDQMRWALQGYLFRISYNYASKYYLDATVRRDGSARFAPQNRWGTFPSFSAAWRISSEDFMKNLTWINDLKIRGGWGQLGNQEVRDMAYLSVISTNPTYAFGSSSTGLYPATGVFNTGATIFGIPNKDLTWEKTETTNIGFDALLFKNLSFSAEYYHKITKGILQAIDIPPSVGVVETPVANVAKVMNRGFEFSANYQGHINQFNYNIGANLTTTTNRVLETYKHIPTSGGTVEEGHSMFYYKAYKVAGIFKTDAEAQAWLQTHSDASYTVAKVGAGDFYFQDLRGAPTQPGQFYSEGPDGKIDSYDMVDIGKSIPGYFYGFNLGADYKGFDFSANFSGVGDVIKYNSIKASTFLNSTKDNVTSIVYNAWTPDNIQNVYPRLNISDPAQNLRYSDFFFESGAYLRLQNIQVGYTLPKSVYTACHNNIRNVRVYLGASNLFTITKYTGLDPENDTYPTPRTFFMGLSAKF